MLVFVFTWLLANAFLVSRGKFSNHFDTLLATCVLTLLISFLFSERKWEAAIVWFFVFVVAIPFSPEVTAGVLSGWLLGTGRNKLFKTKEDENE